MFKRVNINICACLSACAGRVIMSDALRVHFNRVSIITYQHLMTESA